MAPRSTYSTEACVSFFGLYMAASLSRRSSGTLATPTCASRGFDDADSCALVRMRNRDDLPTCGRPMIPVFIKEALSFWLLGTRQIMREQSAFANRTNKVGDSL